MPRPRNPNADEAHAARVKDALATAKAAGIQVGRPASELPEATAQRLVELRRAKLGHRRIADALNAEDLTTPSGAEWTRGTVWYWLDRLGQP